MQVLQIINLGKHIIKMPLIETKMSSRYNELAAKGYQAETINNMICFELGFSSLASMIVMGKITPAAIESGSMIGFDAGIVSAGPQGGLIGGII